MSLLGSALTASIVEAYQRSLQVKSSSDKWYFTGHPYLGPGYESRPIMITSVKTENIERGDIQINTVKLRNISNKRAMAVKIRWYLSTQDDRATILHYGETDFIDIKGGLKSQEATILNFPVISLEKLRREISGNENLKGLYRLELAVTGILFDDDSSWVLGSEQRSQKQIPDNYFKNSFRPGTPEPLTVKPFPNVQSCPKQKCEYQIGTPPYYTCIGSQYQEYCTNCFTTCCSTVCGDPDPACGPCN